MNQKFLVIVIIAVLAGGISLLSVTAFNGTVQAESVESEKHIQGACQSSVYMMDTNKELVLATAGERNAVRKAFWKAYCDANGYQATETGKINPATGLIAGDQFGLEIDNRAKYEIPCVLYVDRDGYYVEYTRFAKNQSSRESEYKNIYTKKQSFSKDYGTATTYHVTYTLGTDVEIEVSDQRGPIRITGAYDFCYEQLGCPRELSFMNSGSTFMEEHDLCVQNAISGAVNYSINAHNTNNKYGRKYVFAMPNDNSSFGRMLRNPCVISFSQGKQISGRNIYGFAGASIEKNRIYYEYIYDNNGTDVKCYTDNNNVETIKVGTMRELAKDGAIPDLD